MPNLRVSPQAVTDVEAIAGYVACERPQVAIRIGARLFRTFQFLAKNPHVGTHCGDIRPGLRVFVPQAPAARYLVFFEHRHAHDVVEIKAVIDGAQDWASILSE